MAGIQKGVSREDQLARIRKKLANKDSKGRKDQNEFRPPQVKPGEERDYYFKILPELDKGETCAEGICSQDYDLYFYQNGGHWVNNKKVECPRVHDDGKCDLCELGFKLLQQEDDEEVRKKIVRLYLPRAYSASNIYFIDSKKNPEELRGKVMWYNAGITVYKLWDKTLNSDDPGDDEDPKAYGMFYDLEAGYVFNLHVLRKGEYPNYEQSKFLTKQSPLVKDEDGEPDYEAIQKILDKRFDIATKFDERDPSKISTLIKELTGEEGDDGDGDGFGKDETKEEVKTESKSVEDELDELEEKPKSKKTEAKTEAKKKTKKTEAKKEEPKSEKVEEAEEKEEEPDLSDDDEELASLLETVKNDNEDE